MSIIAQFASHRGEIAELFVRDVHVHVATLLHAVRDLVTLCTLSLPQRHNQRTSMATGLFSFNQPWRFSHAFATLLAF